MADRYDRKTIIAMVQQLFSYPEGPHVLAWLEELYEFHKAQHIIQSSNPNAPLALAYQAGKGDVVKELRAIVAAGIDDDDKPDSDPDKESLGESYTYNDGEGEDGE